jgi:hypothetical protein
MARNINRDGSYGRTGIPAGADYKPRLTPSAKPGIYNQSRPIKDVGGSYPGNEKPQAGFVNPNPSSPFCNSAWEKKSGC